MSELGVGGGEQLKGDALDVRDAKGPKYGYDGGHSFCPECNRVVYSLWRYGPMTPSEHNRTFCVCDGEQTGIVQQKITVYGVEDVKHDE